MKKYVLAIGFLLFVLITPSFNVFAAENSNYFQNEIYDKICNALTCVYMDKDGFGMTDVDFSCIETSRPIQTYEYIDDSFVRVGEFYPIIYNGHILATASSPLGDGFCISSSILSSTIDKLDCNKMAIIYSYDWVYAYDGDRLIPLYEVCFGGTEDEERPNAYRGVLEVDTLIDYSEIECVDISYHELLGFSIDEIESNLRTSYSCNVSYVTQYPYEKLCWAATLACIKNYLSGTTLSAGGVSCQCFNSPSVIDVGLPGASVAMFMQNTYSMSYSFGSSIPSSNTIITNLSGGYPMFGGFLRYAPGSTTSSGSHAGTIFGYYTLYTYEYINVMDPTYGAGNSVAVSNGTTYVYTSIHGNNMVLNEGICHSW